MEKAFPKCSRPGRLFTPHTDHDGRTNIWSICSCVGAHHCKRRHLGWKQRALAASLWVPEGAISEWMAGALKFRYCTTLFAKRLPPSVLSDGASEGICVAV